MNSKRRFSRPTTPCAAPACGWRIWPASRFREASDRRDRRLADALRDEPAANWNAAQRRYKDSILEGAERMVTAAGPVEGLRAIASFSPI